MAKRRNRKEMDMAEIRAYVAKRIKGCAPRLSPALPQYAVDDERLFDISPLWLARSADPTNGNSQD